MSDRTAEKKDTTRAASDGAEAGRRIPQESIEKVVRQIVDRFQPEQIILFGSYAYGRPGPGSDVDVLVVMDTPLKEMEQAVHICQAIEYHFVPVNPPIRPQRGRMGGLTGTLGWI